jgi:SAM-dependent methyltransferase
VTDRYEDGRHLAENPRWHAEDAPLKADAVMRLLATVGWTPASVVDVGCGSGDVLLALRARLDASWGAHTTLVGWDTSADAAGLWRPTDRVTLRRGDALDDGATAELVLALDVSEHVEDDVGFLRALGRVAPRAILRMPLDDSWLDQLRPARKLAARERYGHLHAYTRALALARVREAGWTMVATALDRAPPRLDTARRRLTDRIRRLGVRLAPGLTVDALGGWSLVVAAEMDGSPVHLEGSRTHR